MSENQLISNIVITKKNSQFKDYTDKITRKNGKVIYYVTRKNGERWREEVDESEIASISRRADDEDEETEAETEE